MLVTRAEFVERANKVHDDKYDYDHMKYVNMKTKIEIVCKTHGIFIVGPQHHVRKTNPTGCLKCRGISRFTQAEFINFANETHNNKYNYDETVYIKSTTKIKVKCDSHGIFIVGPYHHIRQPNPTGCPKCGIIAKRDKLRKSQSLFKEQATQFHNGKYNYDNVEYVDGSTEILINCPVHNNFYQLPKLHLIHGCPECGIDKAAKSRTKTVDDFISKSITVGINFLTQFLNLSVAITDRPLQNVMLKWLLI